MADDDGRYEEVAVLGHDDIWHNVGRDGFTLCSMGRKDPVRYEVAAVG